MTSRHSCTRFIADHTIKDAPVCDAVSRVATMASEMRVNAAANVIELFMQTLVILQTTSILDSELETRLCYPLRPCG
ncbi:hypothetical protein TNCV_1517881 [Trichonephila clavipes]|nr:hypothetical protein TNCV_1517881 [Trichonephila clavipes]